MGLVKFNKNWYLPDSFIYILCSEFFKSPSDMLLGWLFKYRVEGPFLPWEEGFAIFHAEYRAAYIKAEAEGSGGNDDGDSDGGNGGIYIMANIMEELFIIQYNLNRCVKYAEELPKPFIIYYF